MIGPGPGTRVMVATRPVDFRKGPDALAALVSAVARRHALDPSQIYGWRKELIRQFKEQGLDVSSLETEGAAFVPAVITPDPVPEAGPSRRSPRRRRRAASAVVELEIDGVAVKIARGADAGVIAAVIDALRTRA